jgi:signal transduction histidine kinase/CheY-like chemotaxis protein/PAS domain-containing protein
MTDHRSACETDAGGRRFQRGTERIFPKDYNAPRILARFPAVARHDMESRSTSDGANALLRAGVEAWPDAVLVFGRHRTVTYANAAARRLFAEDIEGLSPGRRAERWTFRDTAGRLMPAEASPSARGLRGETVRDMRCELVASDGTRHPLTVDAYPLRGDSSAVDGVMCVLREAREPGDHPRARLFQGQASWLRPAAHQEGPDRRLTLLADAGRALGATLDLTATLESLAGAVVPALADWCVIRVIESDGRVRRLRTVYADKRLEAAARVMDDYYGAHTGAETYASQAGIGRVLRTGEPVLVPEVSPAWLRNVAQDEVQLTALTEIGIASLMHAPLVLRGRTLGVLTFVRTASGPRYGAADLALAEELCDRAAVAVENARLFEASERRASEAHALSAIARVLAETLDLAQVWRRIAEGVRTLLYDAPAAALYALEETGREIHAVAVSTEPGVHFDWTVRLPADAGVVGLAIRERAVVTTEDALADARLTYPAEARARLEHSAYRALLAVPLVVQEQVFGALAVGAHRERRFTEREIELVSAFADHAAVALHNARLFDEAQRRRAEAERAQAGAEAANRAKDDFLAVLSHELRTPLTAILGWVRMLRSGRLAAERVIEALEAIDRNTHVQTRLIDELLDISRIVAGKVELESEPVDLAAVVSDVVNSARQDPRAMAMVSEPVIQDDVVTVLGDPVRLHQVVMNLVSNAVKFTPPHGRVDVLLRRVDEEAELVIRDTGIGMSADELPQIFDRFHQVDRSNTRRHGGLGLGLAIVHHLVQLHGGSVSAESAGRDRGACFTVRLPCAIDLSRVRAFDHATAGIGLERPLAGIRVLFVDDNAEARSLIGAVLEAAGASVSIAASAAEALSALAVKPVDVILSDIGMPDVDGYDFMTQVRSREREAQRPAVPAIAMTAYASAEDRRRALACGFHDHVAKPIDPADLINLVCAATTDARTGAAQHPRARAGARMRNTNRAPR